MICLIDGRLSIINGGYSLFYSNKGGHAVSIKLKFPTKFNGVDTDALSVKFYTRSA